MLSISHAATGAVLASTINNPYLAIPLILLSHYLEDAVCHWDAGTGLGSGRKSRQLAFYHGIIDLVLAGVIVLVLYPFPSQLPTSIFDLLKLPQIWGSFIGLLPDFLEAPRNFLKWEPAFLKPLNHFHNRFHHSTPDALAGLAPQILLLIILFLAR